MSSRLPVVERVMKARKTAVASGCGHVVSTGQRICQVHGGAWFCMPCVLATIRPGDRGRDGRSEPDARDARTAQHEGRPARPSATDTDLAGSEQPAT
jgi:hypothetical protein